MRDPGDVLLRGRSYLSEAPPVRLNGEGSACWPEEIAALLDGGRGFTQTSSRLGAGFDHLRLPSSGADHGAERTTVAWGCCR